MIRSVLIADDEPNARAYLDRLISKRPDLKLLGAMKNGQEVLNFCRTLQPDIVILDVEMPGLSGLETARQLVEKQSHSIIIFSTAFDQYAIAAFEVAALGYLLKPFSEMQLNQVIDRAITLLDTKEKAVLSTKIQEVWEKLERKPTNFLETIEIKEKGLIRKIKVEEVLLFEADSEYVKIHTGQGIFLQRISLQMLELQLPLVFRRVHRSFIINTKFIKNHKYLTGNRFRFTLTNATTVESSRSYYASINEWMLA